MKIHELFEVKVWTISNVLSLMRVLLTPVLGYTLYLENATQNEDYKYFACIIAIIIILTDFLDGYFARLFNQISKLGQFLDPIADKIAAIGVLTFLHFFRDYPLWIIILIIMRDMYSITGAIFLFSKRNIQVKPNIFGKFMIGAIGVSAFLYILSPTFNLFGITLQQISIYFILLFLVLSTLLYWKTYFKLHLENK